MKIDLEDNNCFDLIRLVLAVSVVYSHAFLLGGFGEEGFSRLVHGQTIAGSLAVMGFFGLSGFLVTRSFSQRNDWRRYLRARALRILPGFYLALVFTAFVAAPLIATQVPNGPEWRLANAVEFVVKNFGVRVGAWHVGGIPYGLPYNGSLNGALWSLFSELCCYGMVLLIGLAGWLRGARGRVHVLLMTLGLAAIQAAVALSPEVKHVAPSLLQLTGLAPFVSAFFAGASVYCYREELSLGRPSAVIWGLAALVLLKLGGWSLLGSLVWPLALINLAYSFRYRLRHDLSYGIYIYHFPILQLVASFGGLKWGYGIFLAVGLVASLACAGLSWVLVERPCLRLK